MTLKQKPDKKEFKKLTYTHMKLLYNVALKYTGNVFDAEDIVQETYLMAFNNFHQLRDKTKCKPWMMRILRNNFLKNCQKIKVRNRLTEGEYIDHIKASLSKESAEDLLVRIGKQENIQAAMDKLPEKYKDILVLYYTDELLYKDIAQILEIPIGTVMSRLTRAKEGLKKILLNQAKNGENVLNINFKTGQAGKRSNEL